MLKRTLCFLFMLLISSQYFISAAQNTKLNVFEAKKRNNFIVDSKSAVEIKISTREKKYKIGSLLDLSVAVFNYSSLPIYIRKLNFDGSVFFKARLKDNKIVSLNPHLIQNQPVTGDSFEILYPGSFRSADLFFQIGKNLKEDNQSEMLDKLNFAKSEEEKKEIRQEIFNRELFVNFGDGVLEINEVGTINLFCTFENQFVVFDKAMPKIKTATGTLTSKETEVELVD